MDKIIKNLEAQLEALRILVKNREDVFNDRSERWQESEKGEFFNDQTMDIESEADDLDSLIDNLKELQ